MFRWSGFFGLSVGTSIATKAAMLPTTNHSINGTAIDCHVLSYRNKYGIEINTSTIPQTTPATSQGNFVFHKTKAAAYATAITNAARPITGQSVFPLRPVQPRPYKNPKKA
ncbi:MAG: hypothetical protein ACAH95_05235 [Fimbriimonas sp.]